MSFDKMCHTIRLTILIFSFGTTLSQSNQSVLSYNDKLYNDLFTDYQKRTGPWRNASVFDGGTELVAVKVTSDLYTIDSVVGDDFESEYTHFVCSSFAEWPRANTWVHSSMDNGERRILSAHLRTLQQWKDMQFVWDPAEYGGIRHITVPREDIWFPDVVATQR